MSIRIPRTRLRWVARGGFSLLEVTFAMAAAGLLITTLYAGLTYGFSVMRLARENTRATQILIEKMETIRLYNWEQLNTPGFIPADFQVAYYPIGGIANHGTIYHGNLTVSDTPLTTGYATHIKKVTVTLNWKTSGLDRSRTISTYVSQYGLQNYIYF